MLKEKLVRIWEVVKERDSKERVSQSQSKERVSKEPVRRERVSQRNCSLTVNGIASCAGGGVAHLLLKEVSQEMRLRGTPFTKVFVFHGLYMGCHLCFVFLRSTEFNCDL